MDLTRASAAMAALGHEARLDIFRRLVVAGPDGMNVGEIAQAISIPLSTLFHHLSHLERAGLVAKRRQGRETRCLPDFDAVQTLSRFLLEDCCQGGRRCG